MSISLNNHEQRITTLENGRSKLVHIADINAINNKSFKITNPNQYSVLLLNKHYFDPNTTGSGINWKWSETEATWMIFPDSVSFKNNLSFGNKQDHMFKRIGESIYSWGYHGVRILSDFTFECRPVSMVNAGTNPSPSAQDYQWVGFSIWGLKIYYIFRYNIYKILKLISPILKF